MRPLLLLLAWLIGAFTVSQPLQAAPIFVIPADLHDQSLAGYSDYLIDEDGTVTIEQVRSLLLHRFTPSPSEGLRFGLQATPIWLRTVLANPLDQPRTLIIRVQAPLLNSLQLWSEQGIQQELLSQGRTYPVRHYRYLVTLSPHGQTTLYWRFEHAGLANIQLTAFSQAAYVDQLLNHAAIASLGLGGFAVLCLLILILGLLSQHHWYRWLFPHTLGALIYQAVSQGFADPWIHSAEHQQLLLVTCVLISSIATILMAYTLGIPLRDQPMARRATNALLLTLTLTLLLSPLLPIWILFSLTTLQALSCTGILLLVGTFSYLQGPSLITLGFLGTRVWNLAVLISTSLYSAERLELLEISSLGLMYGILLEQVCLLLIALYASSRRHQQQAHQQELLIASAVRQSTEQELQQRLVDQVRPPLAGIQGVITLLRDEPLSHQQHELLDTLTSAGEQLSLALTGDSQRLGTWQHETRERLDLLALLESLGQELRPVLYQQHAELVIDYPPGSPYYLLGPPHELRQILGPLLTYCAQHLMGNELLINLNSSSTSTLVITINGRFASHHELWRLQRQRHQGSDYLTSHPDPLLIALQLIEREGGELTIGRGGHNPLQLALPRQRLADEGEEISGHVDLRGQRLLIADANSNLVRALQRHARSWGMLVTTCSHGTEAFAQWRTMQQLQQPFDLVALDQTLPGLSGLEVTRRIHQEAGEALPGMLLLSSEPVPPGPEERQACGISRLLRKPLSSRALKIAICETLQQPAQQAGHRLDLQGCTLLLVQHDAIGRKVLQTALQRLQAHVICAENGQQAVALYQQHTPHLILMATELPLMDGVEASQQIRRWEALARRDATPIVALLDHERAEQQERLLNAGMNGSLITPITPERLLSTVQRWLR